MSKLNKIIRILAVAVIAASLIYQAYLAISAMVHGDTWYGMVYCLFVAVITGLVGTTCANILCPVFGDDEPRP